MTADPLLDGPDIIGALHHLTGVSRRRTSWLSLAHHDVYLRDDGDIRLSDEKHPVRGGRRIARIVRTDDGFEIEAADDAGIWVNREPVTTRRPLAHADMIEFGETGPLSRFEMIDEAHRLRRTVPEIVDDAVGYLRASRRPFGRRLMNACRTVSAEFVTETSLFFRLFVLGALIVVGVLAYRQSGEIARLESSLQEGALQQQRIAATLSGRPDPPVSNADLDALRAELGSRLTAQRDRLANLEARSDAVANVIAEATPSIVFIQGSWGFRDKASGRMLRSELDEDGNPARDPFGRPRFSLEGDGPVVERAFTGTGFLVRDRNVVLTNRHVALPWEADAAAIVNEESPLEPAMIRFIGYFSGASQATDLHLGAASDVADLASLTAPDGWPQVAGLELSPEVAVQGSDLIAMGYPTGLLSLLVRAGDAFRARLEAEEGLGFWEVGERLAAAGVVNPLASRGIVAQATTDTLLFDADTTRGGSGGPVLDLSGRVIGIQSAIIADFGGSNIAVPVAKIRAFLAEEEAPPS